MSSVPLKGDRYAGLGFNIYGNSKDGIYVKDILKRGPALRSQRINPGDRILSITVSFEHMAFEDALTILSYASPYNVRVQTLKNPGFKRPTLKHQLGAESGRQPEFHPLIRRHSASELLGKDDSGVLPAMRSKTVQYVAVDIDADHRVGQGVAVQDETEITRVSRSQEHPQTPHNTMTEINESVDVVDETLQSERHFDSYWKTPDRVHRMLHDAPFRSVDSTCHVHERIQAREHPNGSAPRSPEKKKSLEFSQYPDYEQRSASFDSYWRAPDKIHTMLHRAPFRAVDSTSHVHQRLKQDEVNRQESSYAAKLGRPVEFFQDPEEPDSTVPEVLTYSKFTPWLGDIVKPPSSVSIAELVDKTSKYEVSPEQQTTEAPVVLEKLGRASPFSSEPHQTGKRHLTGPEDGQNFSRPAKNAAEDEVRDVWTIHHGQIPRVTHKMKHIAPFDPVEGNRPLRLGDAGMHGFDSRLGRTFEKAEVARRSKGSWEVSPDMVPNRVYLLRHEAPYRHVESFPAPMYPPGGVLRAQEAFPALERLADRQVAVRGNEAPSKGLPASFSSVAELQFERIDERPVKQMKREYSGELIGQLLSARRSSKPTTDSGNQVPSHVHGMTHFGHDEHVESSDAPRASESNLLGQLSKARKSITTVDSWMVLEHQVPKTVGTLALVAPYEHCESSGAYRRDRRSSLKKVLLGPSDGKRRGSGQTEKTGWKAGGNSETPEKQHRFSLSGLLRGKNHREENVYDDMLVVPSTVQSLNHVAPYDHVDSLPAGPTKAEHAGVHVRDAIDTQGRTSREAWVSQGDVVDMTCSVREEFGKHMPIAREDIGSTTTGIDYDNPPVPEIIHGISHTAPYAPPDLEARLPPVRSGYEAYLGNEGDVPREVHGMSHSAPFAKYTATMSTLADSSRGRKSDSRHEKSGIFGRILGSKATKPDLSNVQDAKRAYVQKWYTSQPARETLMRHIAPGREYEVEPQIVERHRPPGLDQTLLPKAALSSEVDGRRQSEKLTLEEALQTVGASAQNQPQAMTVRIDAPGRQDNVEPKGVEEHTATTTAAGVQSSRSLRSVGVAEAEGVIFQDRFEPPVPTILRWMAPFREYDVEPEVVERSALSSFVRTATRDAEATVQSSRCSLPFSSVTGDDAPGMEYDGDVQAQSSKNSSLPESVEVPSSAGYFSDQFRPPNPAILRHNAPAREYEVEPSLVERHPPSHASITMTQAFTAAEAPHPDPEVFFQDQFAPPAASHSTHVDGYIPYYGNAPKPRIHVDDRDEGSHMESHKPGAGTYFESGQTSRSFAPSLGDQKDHFSTAAIAHTQAFDWSVEPLPPDVIHESTHYAPYRPLVPGCDGLSAYQVESLLYRTRGRLPNDESDFPPGFDRERMEMLSVTDQKKSPVLGKVGESTSVAVSTEPKRDPNFRSFSYVPPAVVVKLEHKAPYEPFESDRLGSPQSAYPLLRDDERLKTTVPPGNQVVLRDEGNMEPVPYFLESGKVIFAFPLVHNAPVAKLAPEMDGYSARRLAEAIAGKQFVAEVTKPRTTHTHITTHHAPSAQAQGNERTSGRNEVSVSHHRAASNVMEEVVVTGIERSSMADVQTTFSRHARPTRVDPGDNTFSTIIVLDGRRVAVHKLEHTDQTSPYQGLAYRLESNNGVIIDMRGEPVFGVGVGREYQEGSATLDTPSRSLQTDVTYVVTARPANISGTSMERRSADGQDPYAELSYRDRLDVLRLSYEDSGVSKSTPDLAAESPSPSFDRRVVQGRPPIRQGMTRAEPIYAERIPDVPSSPPPPFDRRTPLDGFIGSSREMIAVGPEETAIRTTSYYRSGSADAKEASSGMRSHSPSPAYQAILKRDSGYGTLASGGITVETRDRPDSTSPLSPASPVSPASLDHSQYQKLLYFQQQVAKQNEELAQLGISVPNLDPLPPMRDIPSDNDF